MTANKFPALLCGLCLSLGFTAGVTAEIDPTTAAKAADTVAADIIEEYRHLDTDNIRLGSVKAAVFDPASATMLYSKNADVQAPIASVTKLMTAMVVIDGAQSLDEKLTINRVERDSGKNSYSRIRIGSRLSRRDLLRIMLMASENLAAANLAYHFSGGFDAFIGAMNAKARELGMTRTQFMDASGLSVNNQSTAADVVKMVTAAAEYDLIREFTTTPGFTANFENPRYSLRYGNTNRLVHRSSWEVGISKTGYLNEAGRCLVMTTAIDGRSVTMVLLDSFGKLTPIGDAGRIKRWLTTGSSGTVAGAALNYERSKSASYR